MPERSLDASETHPSAQATGQAQILQAIPAIRTQFDYNMISLLGIQQSFDMFGGMAGISDARQQQFDSFSRGEVGSISGTGLSESNLRRLESMKGEALRYGIEINVDLENRRFEITNTNYAPISMMSPEEHATLVSAVLKGQEYLETAETLRSQGRSEEAEVYVARAMQLQAVFSTYIEAFTGIEAAQGQLGNMENAPRAGGSERVAQELVRAITGRGVSGAELPAEFERITGVSYDEFLVREEGGELVGRGISAVAERDYGEAVNYARQGIAGLGTALQMVYDGTSLGSVQDENGQAQLASSQAFNDAFMAAASAMGNAGALAEVGTGIMNNVYQMMVARNGAVEMDSINFDQIFTVRREVRPDVPPDQVAAVEYESYLMPGFDRHYGSLEGDRLSARRSFSNAEGDFRDAAIYMMAQPETQAGAEQYARLSGDAESDGQRHLGDAGQQSGHLRDRVASILTYEPIWQEINSFAYTVPLGLADPSGALMAEKDVISSRLDEAMRDGTTVENLGMDLRNLEYNRMASGLERFQFPEVRGAKAREGLDEARDQLAGALRDAASSGTEITNLGESNAKLMGAYEECINFERTVVNAAGRLYANAETLRSGIKETNERTAGVLRDIPDDVTYTEEAHGDTAARDYRVDLRDNKRLISERLETLDGYSAEIIGQEQRINGWLDETINSYEPSLVVESRATFDLEGRYGVDNSSYFEGLRGIDAELRDTGTRVGASFRILADATQGMVGEYRQGLEDAQSAAASAGGIDLADPFSWALGGALFRGGQLGWRGAQAVWRGITTKAAQEGGLAFAARTTEVVARAVPTIGTITQNTYAGYEMATANNFDEFMEGATWMGALGSTGGLVGVVGKGAKFLSVAVDALAVGTMVAGIGYQTYKAFETGGGEWWDLARVGGMGALGIFGSTMGLAGSFGMRVPGGFRNILPGGLLGSRIVNPGEAAHLVQAGGRAFGEMAEASVPLRQLTPMEREGMQASAAATRQAEDLTAINTLRRQYDLYTSDPQAYLRSIPGGVEGGLPEEMAALLKIRREHPDWNPTQLAVSYVDSLRVEGAAIPARLLAGVDAYAGAARAAGVAPSAVSPAQRAAEDSEAIRALSQEYSQVQRQAPSGRAMQVSPEVNDMIQMSFLHPEWAGDAERLATEYVKFLRMSDIPIPPRILGRVEAAPAQFMPTQAMESPLASSQAAPVAARRPDFVVEVSPPLNARQVEMSASVLPETKRGYMLEQLGGRQADQATVDNALAVLGGREVEGSFGGVTQEISEAGYSVRGFFD